MWWNSGDLSTLPVSTQELESAANLWETDLEEELKMIDLNCTGTVRRAAHAGVEFWKDTFHRVNRR